MACVKEAKLAAPTRVQARAIPAILRGESVLLGAATGTGKTLACVLPIAHALKRDEEAGLAPRRPARPRVIILAPTRELVLQTLAVVKQVCHTAKLRALALVGGSRQSQQVTALEAPVDVIVASPGRLLLHLRNRDIYFTDVRTLVVDETDTMVNAQNGFLDELQELLSPVRARLISAAAAAPARTPLPTAAEPERDVVPLQVVCAGASMPAAARRTLSELFPRVKDLDATASADAMHIVPRAVQQHFYRVGGAPEAKHDMLLSIMAEIRGAGRQASSAHMPRVLVFCNTIASTRSTAHHLVETGNFSTACLHGDMPPNLRTAQYREFLDGKCPVLVCTDAAARGLDIAQLTHVVLFDFPLNPIEYLHRVGRVGRAGVSGHAYSLVAPRDVVLAKGIELAAENNSSIAALTSSRSELLARTQRRNPSFSTGHRDYESRAAPRATLRRGEPAPRRRFYESPRR